jgi:hypothetical protein
LLSKALAKVKLVLKSPIDEDFAAPFIQNEEVLGLRILLDYRLVVPISHQNHFINHGLSLILVYVREKLMLRKCKENQTKIFNFLLPVDEDSVLPLAVPYPTYLTDTYFWDPVRGDFGCAKDRLICC